MLVTPKVILFMNRSPGYSQGVVWTDREGNTYEMFLRLKMLVETLQSKQTRRDFAMKTSELRKNMKASGCVHKNSVHWNPDDSKDTKTSTLAVPVGFTEKGYTTQSHSSLSSS